MASIEVKLAQQLMFLDQKPWHQIFLDLHKAYNNMDLGENLRNFCRVMLLALLD
jgi:hypothetical protein